MYEFRKCVERYNGNYRVLSFSCLDQFLSPVKLISTGPLIRELHTNPNGPAEIYQSVIAFSVNVSVITQVRVRTILFSHALERPFNDCGLVYKHIVWAFRWCRHL
jgi:hypothetical protein